MKNNMVYICAPYRDNPEKNTQKAKDYARHVYKRGFIPFSPQLAAKFFDDGDGEAMKYCIAVLNKMDELWIFGDRITSGMEEEITWWEKQGEKKTMRTVDDSEVY